ncbi:MAG: restriction endonuclease subunit S [Proteobacteria bacterium]|nr:restriction endonuclease subunit S [Pseudomonadota bacterium]
MKDELPSGWARAKLDEIALINPPGASTTVPDAQEVTFIPMAAVEALTGRIDVSHTRAFGEVKKGFTRFREGDVLFAKITPCMENGKIAVARGLRDGVGCGSTEFHVLRPTAAATPEYLRYYLVQSGFRREAQRNMQGAVGQQRIPPDYLRESALPVAPRREQQRIVSRIEELFSEIDEGERALEHVRKLVERYRQSVLKAAVTGELTRQWRAANSAFEWSRQEISDIGEVTTGSTPPTADPDNYGPGLPFLKPTDLDQGYAVTTGRQSLTKQGLHHCRPLKANTVLVTCIGATIGKLGLTRMPCATNQQINAVEVDHSRMRAKFLYWYLASPAGQQAIIGGASATTLPILNKSRFQSIEVPVPSLAEQDVLISVIEQHMEQADRAMSTVEHESHRSHALRQAILKAAFSGQLVPQDPADEPASALLARLAKQAGEAQNATQRKGRRVRTAAP